MNPNPLAHSRREKAARAEKQLGTILRDRRFSACKFRRQHKVGEHYLDFDCAEARYNLELDGSQHGFPELQAKDSACDEYLRSRNIQTRLFGNSQLKDIRFVRDTIRADLQARAPHSGNQPPEKRMRLPKRLENPGARAPSHPSPRPAPRWGERVRQRRSPGKSKSSGSEIAS